jgi:penicillin-binding protein 1B
VPSPAARSSRRGLSSGPASVLTLVWLAAIAPGAHADPWTNPLEREIGRAEVRVRSAAYAPLPGTFVAGAALPERLQRLGYRRVGTKPEKPGQYFWGDEIFWIYRRSFRLHGDDHQALLFGLPLRRGEILGALDGDRRAVPVRRLDEVVLEPETLAESLTADRAPRIPIALEELPEKVWRPLLAIEDHRFFEHAGVDARAIARALLKNLLAGRIAEGGSTLTQQLVKNRDLTPKRSLGRKLSEAARALALEEAYDKRDILETYLNHVYLGHQDGLALHGLGTAARAYFSKPAAQLTLGEAALLAGVIQSPNRLNPWRHPEAARERQLVVLRRLEELQWASADELRVARAKPPRLSASGASTPPAAHLLSWIRERVAVEQTEAGRGVVVETSIDAHLQSLAEDAVRASLAGLRKGDRRLRSAPLQAALVALDARDGAILAYVGGDPGTASAFDRARGARRQPGSAVKPLVLLESFDQCGSRRSLSPATRVLDEPITLALPTGPWQPVNTDGKFRGTVTIRTALAESLNVPLVRLARHCGFATVATRFRAVGLELPPTPPPSFVLGASVATPLQMAGAFTPFAAAGEFHEPRAVTRIEQPSGRRLWSARAKSRRIASAEAAFLVHDLLREAVATGTGKLAAIAGIPSAGKTGSSSDQRDAWFVGDTGAIVTAVWVGLDDNERLGLSGAAVAAPLWRTFMAEASRALPPRQIRPPRGIVRAAVDDDTGRSLSAGSRSARLDYFQHDRVPPRKWIFSRRALAVIE